MRYRVLGSLAVTDGDVDVTPRGEQQRRLVTALVSRAPAAVPVDALEEVLWPGGAPSANALQALVSKLRRALPSAALVHGPGGYSLDLAPADEVDVREFEAWCASARAAGDRGDHREAVEGFDAALGLVAGVPLADIADSDLGRGESVRLAGHVRAARARAVEERLAAGLTDDAATELEALTTAEPFDEHWWALLMIARYRQGRQADALRTFQTARAVLADQLGVEPGPELRAVERRVLDHDPALSAPPLAPAPPHSRRAPALPARLTSFVGRDELLDDLADDVRSGRLLTLLGPGGAGKTSVALELARRMSGQLDVAYVELAPVVDDDATIGAVAAVLGMAASEPGAPGSTGSTIDRVIDVLCGAPTLLVLDNCEHVVGAAAKIVHRLLESCPDLTVMATSREALAVPGEQVRVLPALDQDAAVSLFLDRARGAADGREPTDSDIAHVTKICDRLDRLPLAIELAAARLRSMTPAELLDRLDDRFTALGTGARTVEPRQRTLRAVVDWSHALLDEAERRVFRRISAFQGGATMSMLEAVCGDADLVDASMVPGLVERLIDKSLLVARRDHDMTRYSMLQTLHEYAAERLRESDEVERVLDRHARHLADLLAPAERGLLGRGQKTWIERLDVERDNLRVALDVAVARGDADLALRLVVPVGWYFFMIAQADTGAEMFEEALSCPGPVTPRRRALALAHYGWLTANGSVVHRAVDATAEAMALLGAVDDPWVEAFVASTRVMALFYAARIDEIRTVLPLCLDAAQRSDDPWAQAIASVVKGEVAHHDGQPDVAEAAFNEAIDDFQLVGDEFSLTICVAEAAEIAEMRGEYDRAAEMLARGISTSERVGFSAHPIAMRTRLANIEVLRGSLELAERMHLDVIDDLVGESQAWIRAMSYGGLAVIARRTGRLDEAEQWLERAWALRRTIDVASIRALVLVSRGYTADLRGDRDAALRFQLDGLAAVLEHLMPRNLANSFEGLAGALALGDDPDEHVLAAELLGAADALRRGAGGPMPAAERFDVDRAERRCRGRLGDDAFEQAFGVGAGRPPDDLIRRVELLG